MKKKRGYLIYLDVLGYKNIIKDKNEEDIEKLRHYIALFNKEFISEKASKFYEDYDDKKLIFNCYSDNFLIFYESNEIELTSFAISLLFASHLCIEAIINGFLLRGSIVHGELEYNDNIVFGKSLIESYELEEAHVEPNIVLSKELKLFYQNNQMYKGDLLSPFSMVDINDKVTINKIYNGIKMLITRLNSQPIIDERIIHKYKWLIDEFNRIFNPNFSMYLYIFPGFIEVTLSENI